MMEDALQWWSDYSAVNQESMVPHIEQASILLRYGEYDKASMVAGKIPPDEEGSLSASQKRRVEELRRNLKRASKEKESDIFCLRTPITQDGEKLGHIVTKSLFLRPIFCFS